MTALQSLNRLGKWRTFFAGWQLGTRPIGDPESDAVRDHREATLILRTELSALVELAFRKNLFTMEEWDEEIIKQAEDLMRLLEHSYPGVRATDDGLQIDARAKETMKGWKP